MADIFDNISAPEEPKKRGLFGIFDSKKNVPDEGEIDFSNISDPIEPDTNKSTLGAALKSLNPVSLGANLIASGITAVQGAEGASVTDKGVGDEFVSWVDEQNRKLSKEYEGTGDFIPGLISKQDVAQLGQNLGFSGVSMGASVAAGAAALPAGPIPAALAAMGAGGVSAYRMQGYQQMQEWLNQKNEDSIKANGRPLTPQEEVAVKSQYIDMAKKSGMWEAIPEAAGNVSEIAILQGKRILESRGGAPGAVAKVIPDRVLMKVAKAIAKAGGVFGVEELTETITQMGQHNTNVEAGMSNEPLRDWTNPDDILKSAKEVLGPVLLLTGVMGAGNVVVNKLADRISKDPNTEEIKKQMATLDPEGTIDLEGKRREAQALELANAAIEPDEVEAEVVQPIAKTYTPEEISALESESEAFMGRIDAGTLTPEDVKKANSLVLERVSFEQKGKPIAADVDAELERRKIAGPDAQQLITVERKKPITKMEEAQLKLDARLKKVPYVPPVESVQLTPAQHTEFKAQVAAEKAEQKKQDTLKKQETVKNEAVKNTKFYQTVSALDEGSALKYVLESIKTFGLATESEYAGKVAKTDKRTGRTYLTQAKARQILAGRDYTETKDVRDALSKYGFSLSEGMTRKGKYKLDELADELNSSGVEAPPQRQGHEYTGEWTPDDVLHILKYQNIDKSLTSAKAEIEYHETAMLNAQEGDNARIKDTEKVESGAIEGSRGDIEAALAESPFAADWDEADSAEVNSFFEEVAAERKNQQKQAVTQPNPITERMREVRRKLNDIKTSIAREPSPAIGGVIEGKKQWKTDVRLDARMSRFFDFVGNATLTPDQVAKYFEDITKQPFRYKWLADILKGYGLKVDFNWASYPLDKNSYLPNTDMNQNSWFGQYSFRNKMIMIGKPERFELVGAFRAFQETFAHEGIHAVIFRAIYGEHARIGGRDVAKLTNQLWEFADNLKEMDLTTAPELVAKLFEHYSKNRDIDTLSEIVAYGLTKPDFAAWLDSIPSNVKGRPSETMWQRFKEIILDFIGGRGLVGQTKLDELSQIMDNYFELNGGTIVGREGAPGVARSLAPPYKQWEDVRSWNIVLTLSGENHNFKEIAGTYAQALNNARVGLEKQLGRRVGSLSKQFDWTKNNFTIKPAVDIKTSIAEYKELANKHGGMTKEERRSIERRVASDGRLTDLTKLLETAREQKNETDIKLLERAIKELRESRAADRRRIDLKTSAAAWHGGHKFDKFKLDETTTRTGTGGMNQGHGLYFATRKAIAQWYKSLIADKNPNQIEETINDMVDDIREEIADGNPDNTAAIIERYINNRTRTGEIPTEISKELHEAITIIIESPASNAAIRAYRKMSALAKPYGLKTGLYKVELAPEEDEYLLWDEPFSKQSKKVKELLQKVFLDETFPSDQEMGQRELNMIQMLVKEGHSRAGAETLAFRATRHNMSRRRDIRTFQKLINDNADGERFYKAISQVEGSDKQASEYLHSIGIRGNKYLDNVSRDVEKVDPDKLRLQLKRVVKAYDDFGWNELSDKELGIRVRSMINDKDIWDSASSEVLEYLRTPESREKLFSSVEAAINKNITHNYVIFKDEDVEIKEIFTSITGIDKRLLTEGRVLGWGKGPYAPDISLTKQEIDNAEKQIMSRLVSLTKDDYDMVGQDVSIAIKNLLRKGDYYEGSVAENTKGGFGSVPSGYERQGRALAAIKQVILRGKGVFSDDLIEGVRKEKLTLGVISLFKVEQARTEAKRDDIKKRWEKEVGGDYTRSHEIVKLNTRLAEITKSIKEMEAMVEPTITIDKDAHKNKFAAPAYELGREHGYEVIFIKEHYGTLNGFLSPSKKQIYVDVNKKFTALQIVGHELSESTVDGPPLKGHQTNADTQKLIDEKSQAVKDYQNSISEAAGIYEDGKLVLMDMADVLREYAADLQGGIEENYEVNLNEGLKQQDTTHVLGGYRSLAVNPVVVDVLTRGPTYKETPVPVVKNASREALGIIKNHDKKPMAFSAAIEQYQMVTGKQFKFKEMIEALDKYFVEVAYDSSKMSNKNALAEYNDEENTIYINPNKFGEGADIQFEAEMAFNGVMAIVENASIGKPMQDVIRLKNELTSFKQRLEPFVATAPPEAKRLYGLIGKSDIKNMMGFITNEDFAGWLNSLPSYSLVGKQGFFSRLKDIILRFVGKQTAMGKTKLAELSEIMDKYVTQVGSGHEANTLAEARRYISPKSYIKAVSYTNTFKTTVIRGTKVYIYKNLKGQLEYEPVNFKQAIQSGWREEANTLQNRIEEIEAGGMQDTAKGRRDRATLRMLRQQIEDIIHPLATEHKRLIQIWRTAHGLTARETTARNIAERDRFAQLQAQKPVVPTGETKEGSKREITLAKEAAGFSITNRKKIFAGERAELPVKKGPIGVETLDKNLVPLAAKLANAVRDPQKYGSPEATRFALAWAVSEMYPKADYANYMFLRAEKMSEILSAVEDTVADRIANKTELVIPAADEVKAQKEIMRAQAWTDRTRAWQAGLNVSAPVIEKKKVSAPTDRSEATNYFILRRGGTEIGHAVMDVAGDTIQMKELVVNRNAQLSSVLANIFRQNMDVQNIKMEIDPKASKKEIKTMQILGGMLTTLGAKFNFTMDGKSEYILNRDNLGTAIDSLNEARKNYEAPIENFYAQPKITQATFGAIYDYFNAQILSPEEVSDIAEERAAERLTKSLRKNYTETFESDEYEVEADYFNPDGSPRDIVDAMYEGDIKLMRAWHKVGLPNVPKELQTRINGNWLNRPTDMPENLFNEMTNRMVSFGGIKNKFLRKVLSLPFHNALKSKDWANVYQVLGVDRIENRDRLAHTWVTVANKFLDRRKWFKQAGYTSEQMKAAEYNIGRVVTIGDENLRNIMADLHAQIKEIDAKIKTNPLFTTEKITKQRDALQAKYDQLVEDRRYSFEDIQKGIDDNGEKVTFTGPDPKLEYEMYKSIRAVEDSIFKTTIDHMQTMLLANYSKQKWYKILTTALGDNISDDAMNDLVTKLKGASTVEGVSKITAKEVTIKLRDIFKRMDNKLTAKEKADAFANYEKIASNITKELNELKSYIGELGVPAAELDKITKELFVAYQRTRPRLQKIKDLRNQWREWPGFFPRKRTQGNIKMKLFERYADKTGAIQEREVYSGRKNLREDFGTVRGCKQFRKI
jgi:small-conductance mechanosensitive channel